MESEAHECFRIARDLHDLVGQMLTVIKKQLSNLFENEALGTLVDKTITEVRQISRNLMHKALNSGLKRALEEPLEKSQIDGRLSISLEYNIEKSQLKW